MMLWITSCYFVIDDNLLRGIYTKHFPNIVISFNREWENVVYFAGKEFNYLLGCLYNDDCGSIVLRLPFRGTLMPFLLRAHKYIKNLRYYNRLLNKHRSQQIELQGSINQFLTQNLNDRQFPKTFAQNMAAWDRLRGRLNDAQMKVRRTYADIQKRTSAKNIRKRISRIRHAIERGLDFRIIEFNSELL